MAELDLIADALYTLADGAIGSDVATYEGIKLLQMGTLPGGSSDELPGVTFRLLTFNDSFGILDMYWIFNCFDVKHYNSALLAKKVNDLFRDASHSLADYTYENWLTEDDQEWLTEDDQNWVYVASVDNLIAFKTESRILQSVPEKGATNTPVEVRVTVT